MQQHQFVVNERPYGMPFVPDQQLVEYTDPRNEAIVDTNWRQIMTNLGFEVMAVADVPTTPQEIEVDGIRWRVERITDDRGLEIPPTVWHRLRAAEAAQVPIAYYLWGEEQFPKPRFRPDASLEDVPTPPRPATVRPEAAAAPPITLSAAGAAQPGLWTRFSNWLRDPILIVVIPTAPNRGLWCLAGRWFH